MRSVLLPAVAGWMIAGGGALAQEGAKEGAPAKGEVEVYREARRPLVHFTAKNNWLNDPNGLVFYEGEYHLFFQHNPNGIEWGDMTWGHAVSRDLVRWTQIKNALEPDAMGTMYSGSAVVDWKNTSGFGVAGKDGAVRPPLVAMYTAAGGKSEASKGKPFTQCLAFSNDKGRTWTKYSGNPVIGHIAAENRDPKVVWHEPTQRWICALYEDGSRFSLHASPDLKSWTKLQEIEMPGCSECPDFFEIPFAHDAQARRWVLTAADGRYLVGAFDGKAFVPEGGLQRLDFGRNFYAVQTFSDIPESRGGRRVQVAWMRGPRIEGMPFNQQMSFPTELKLNRTAEGPRLFRTPVAEVSRLHEGEKAVRGVCTKPGTDDGWLAGLKGEAFHIRAEIELGTAAEVGLVVRGEPVRYVVADKTLHALGEAVVEPEKGAGRLLRLELIVDRGSIETFAQEGRLALAGCFEPKVDAAPVSVLIKGGDARVTVVAVPLKTMWELRGR